MVAIDVAGHQVPFASPEDLVVLKMLWRRAKDVADVQSLLSARHASIDWAYIRGALSTLLPDRDPRHAEIAALERRFRPA